jgi:hypothetical protein
MNLLDCLCTIVYIFLRRCSLFESWESPTQPGLVIDPDDSQ